MAQRVTVTAAIAAALLGVPGRASAQSVKVDVKVSADISREIRAALRDVTTSVSEALREVSREVNVEIARELPRDLNIKLNLGNDIGRDITRSLGRDLDRELADGLKDLPKLGRLGAFDGPWGNAQERNWRGEAIDRQTRALAIGANGTLELHNLSGDITVNAGRGSGASIELVRRSRGRTDADARTGLDRVTVDTQVVGTRATVKTNYSNERQSNYSVSVDMIVTAPAGTRVTVNSVSGDVKMTGIRGDVTVQTVSGDVVLANLGAISEAKTASGDVTITGSSSDGTLDAGTLSGDVVLTQVKARKIAGSTVSGSVTARDVSCESATLSTMSGDAIFSGDPARNGRYEITSHSGDVRFTPTGSVGFTLSANSFGGEINSSIPLERPAGSRTRRQSMTGKVGDGSATVTLQTFNGDITIGGGVRR
jgi:DUF4097 and DUF4098 domain-containing protein YvlB